MKPMVLGIPARADNFDFYRLTLRFLEILMPVQSGDVSFPKSAVMADVPEGGGAPRATQLPMASRTPSFLTSRNWTAPGRGQQVQVVSGADRMTPTLLRCQRDRG